MVGSMNQLGMAVLLAMLLVMLFYISMLGATPESCTSLWTGCW